MVLGSIPLRQLRLLHIFHILFSRPRKFQSNYHFSLTFLNYYIFDFAMRFINKMFYVIIESDAYPVDYSSFFAKETKLQSL